MHAVEHVRRGVRRAAPIIDDAAVREMRVDVARMHLAALAHELEHGLRALHARGAPARAGGARVHQRMVRAWQEAVVDERVFFDVERRVLRLEIACAVAGDAMPERQVLRARRRADRIGLHESEPLDRAAQVARREQRTGDGVAAKIVEGRRRRHRANEDANCAVGGRSCTPPRPGAVNIIDPCSTIPRATNRSARPAGTKHGRAR